MAHRLAGFTVRTVAPLVFAALTFYAVPANAQDAPRDPDPLEGTDRSGWRHAFPAVGGALNAEIPVNLRPPSAGAEGTSFAFGVRAFGALGTLPGLPSLGRAGWQVDVTLALEGRFQDSNSTPVRPQYLGQLGAAYYRPVGRLGDARWGVLLRAVLAHYSNGGGPSSCAFRSLSCDAPLPPGVDPGAALDWPYPNQSTHFGGLAVGLATRARWARSDLFAVAWLEAEVHAPSAVPGAMAPAERDAFGGETVRLHARASLLRGDLRLQADAAVDWSSGYVPWHASARLGVGHRAAPFNAFVRLDVGRVPFGALAAVSATTIAFGIAVDLPTVIGF